MNERRILAQTNVLTETELIDLGFVSYDLVQSNIGLDDYIIMIAIPFSDFSLSGYQYRYVDLYYYLMSNDLSANNLCYATIRPTGSYLENGWIEVASTTSTSSSAINSSLNERFWKCNINITDRNKFKGTISSVYDTTNFITKKEVESLYFGDSYEDKYFVIFLPALYYYYDYYHQYMGYGYAKIKNLGSNNFYYYVLKGEPVEYSTKTNARIDYILGSIILNETSNNILVNVWPGSIMRFLKRYTETTYQKMTTGRVIDSLSNNVNEYVTFNSNEHIFDIDKDQILYCMNDQYYDYVGSYYIDPNLNDVNYIDVRMTEKDTNNSTFKCAISFGSTLLDEFTGYVYNNKVYLD